MTAEKALEGYEGAVLVLNGDGPLLRTETLRELVETQADQSGMTVATCHFKNPFGLGRIIRDESHNLSAIVEEKDATPEQREITEVNPGLYIFDNTVFSKTKRLTNNNKGGEYYVTDLPLIYIQDQQPVRSYLVEDENEVLGANDRNQLTVLESILRDRIRTKWMTEGVTMIAPAQTFIDDTVELSRDVVLEPGVVLKGKTRIAEGARIGAYAYLANIDIVENEVVPPHTVKLA